MNKITTADKIRRNLVFLVLTLVIPGITYFFLMKNYPDMDGLLMIGIVIAAVVICYFAYMLLFSKYEDDLPPLGL